MTTQRTWLVVAALALGGCVAPGLCAGDRATAVAFVEMERYRAEITACIRDHACDRLCTVAFALDARVESCGIMSVVREDATTQQGPIDPLIDLASLHGANVTVTYVAQVTCDDGSNDWWPDWWDSTDEGSGDDGSCDDGSCDDGSGNDGSCDDGSCDDGSGDDGSGDDGSGDDGSGDDGSGDDGSGDDGSGDDGSGDDGSGDVARPTPEHAADRTPAASPGHRRGHR